MNMPALNQKKEEALYGSHRVVSPQCRHFNGLMLVLFNSEKQEQKAKLKNIEHTAALTLEA